MKPDPEKMRKIKGVLGQSPKNSDTKPIAETKPEKVETPTIPKEAPIESLGDALSMYYGSDTIPSVPSRAEMQNTAGTSRQKGVNMVEEVTSGQKDRIYEIPKAPQAELSGLMKDGAAIQMLHGFNPYADYAKMVQDRETLDQERLAATKVQFGQDDQKKIYTAYNDVKQSNSNAQSGMSDYQKRELDLKGKQLELQKEQLNIVDIDFTDLEQKYDNYIQHAESDSKYKKNIKNFSLQYAAYNVLHSGTETKFNAIINQYS